MASFPEGGTQSRLTGLNLSPSGKLAIRTLYARTQKFIMSTKMIVGLGNPGPEYVNNRHNIGFLYVDLYARQHNISLSKMQFKARVGSGTVRREGAGTSFFERLSAPGPSHKVLLVKPLTYMNLSGEAVGALLRYYDVALEDLIVVHDDIDLESGRIRLRAKGGSGGQNGIKSIIKHVGDHNFARLRVGIGRPVGRMDAAAYVLQDFSSEERPRFSALGQDVAEALTCWLFEGIDAAMNQFNG